MFRRILQISTALGLVLANNDKTLESRLGPVVDLGYAVSMQRYLKQECES